MAPQPKLTVVNKVPNILSVLLGLTQRIHTREAIVLRHAMTARAKVICTSRISSIYNTHGRTGSDWGWTGGRTRDRTGGRFGGSDWGRTGVGLGVGLGIGLGVGLGGRTGVGLGEADMGSDWRVRHGVELGVGLGG